MRQRGNTHRRIMTVVALCLFAVAGCAHGPNLGKTQPSIGQVELLSGKILFDSNIKTASLPDDGVMKISETMRNYLYRHIPQKASKREKLRRLLSLMFTQGNLGITYNPTQTLTAESTFISGSGNCLGVSYLFSSMAKELGLTTYFQNVAIPPLWGMQDDMLYKYRHVNVEVPLSNRKSYIVDVNLKANLPTYKTNRISEKNAIAQYYSNKGATYLAKKDYLKSFLYFKKAITIDPNQAEFWTNLGVLYSRNEKLDYAESAYKTALALQANNLTTISNIATLYKKMGLMDLSAKYKAMAKRETDKNPYLRFVQALGDFENGDYSTSLSNIKWAIDHEKNEPRFYKLLAQIYEKTNQPEKAHSATLKSQKIAEKLKRIIIDKSMKIRFYAKN